MSELKKESILNELEFFLRLEILEESDFSKINVIVRKWLEFKNLYKPIVEITPQLLALRQHKLVFLQEFISYCQKTGRCIPRLSEIDPEEGAKLDADLKNAWRVIFLKICHLNTAIAEDFPQTMKHLSTINHSLAMFSILEPHTSIPEHCGYNCIFLRYHLGLIIPPKCFITIDGKKYTWQPDIYFDDTFQHSVKNESDKFRVVLLLDVIRDMHDDKMNEIVNKLVIKAQKSHLVESDMTKANYFHSKSEIKKT